MRKKIFCFMMVPLAVTLLLGGCAKQEPAEDDLPQLVIGSDDYHPYNYIDESGSPAGIDVDIAQEACRRIGYEAVFHQINWNEKDSLLASGEVDCLWGCFSMNGREDDYLWAGPYAYSIQSVAVLANSDINTFSDLESKRVAVQMSSKAESIFSDMTDERIPEVINIYCMLNTDEMATALRKCYVDACAGHEFALRDALNEAGIEFRILDEDLLRSELGVAFSLDGDAALRDKLAAVLEEMRSDGTMEQIFSRYDIDVEKSLGRAE